MVMAGQAKGSETISRLSRTAPGGVPPLPSAPEQTPTISSCMAEFDKLNSFLANCANDAAGIADMLGGPFERPPTPNTDRDERNVVAMLRERLSTMAGLIEFIGLEQARSRGTLTGG